MVVRQNSVSGVAREFGQRVTNIGKVKALDGFRSSTCSVQQHSPELPGRSKVPIDGARQTIVTDSKVAIPRKLKKPTTSVTVVRMTEPDTAGSIFIFLSRKGTMAPE